MPLSLLALNDGTKAPWIAFGTGTASYGKDVQQSVTVAIQNGFTHVDGAQQYQNEDSLGAGIAASGKPRSELYITTKLGNLKPGDTPRSALEESLRKLGVDYVDLYLIHHALPNVGRLKDIWIGMEEAKNAGLTKSIGVSNFTSDHLGEILEVATIPPAVNQLEVHPYVWTALQPTLSLHRKFNIVTSSYGGLSPIVRGRGGPLDPVVASIRTRLEHTRGAMVSEGQVLQRYLQQKGILVVTTSTKVERIREYLDTENVPELTPDEIEDIEAAGAKLHKRFFELAARVDALESRLLTYGSKQLLSLHRLHVLWYYSDDQHVHLLLLAVFSCKFFAGPKTDTERNIKETTGSVDTDIGWC